MSADRLNRRRFLAGAASVVTLYAANRLVKNTNAIEEALLCGENQIGMAREDNEGRVYVCFRGGNWVLQEPDPKIIYGDDGKMYTRTGIIPGNFGDKTYRFSRWAGKSYINPETGEESRNACFSTTDGLGCDMTYRVEETSIDNSLK